MKVVFDPNIVVSASFWRGAPFHCLSAWAQGKCEAVVSPELLAEYHETIEEMVLEYPQRPQVKWADALTESATLTFPKEHVKGATIDPDDEMILECALAAEADYIVSGDKKHLLPLRRFREIPIITAPQFLQQLNK